MCVVQVVANKDCHCCSHELHLLFSLFHLKGAVQTQPLAIGSATSATGRGEKYIIMYMHFMAK